MHSIFRPCLRLVIAALALTLAGHLGAYPIDGYERTGIGRLEAAARIEAGRINGTKQPLGALLPTTAVDLRLLDQRDLELPAIDQAFTADIRRLLGAEADRYAVSVLDLSDLDNPRYAEHDGVHPRNPGSVGKLMVALGIFQALADIYPDDVESRWQVMHDSEIVADEFILTDGHTVRRWDRTDERLIRRPLQVGDRGSFLEFMDWMLSASSNAAAATMMKHGMLLRHFGRDYPVSAETGQNYFRTTPKAELRDALVAFIQEPVTRNGLDLGKLRQGSFFTATGKRKVPGTNSYATTRELMKYILRMEQGRLVDEFSSRELKRLLYITERRIRYASAPGLRDAAVYFKSGSLFKCEPEEDFSCRAYAGNVYNYMNSVAIVESPATERDLFYLVTLTSNVLRRNSAVEHQTFATRLHRVIEAFHKERIAAAAAQPESKPEPEAQAEAVKGASE